MTSSSNVIFVTEPFDNIIRIFSTVSFRVDSRQAIPTRISAKQRQQKEKDALLCDEPPLLSPIYSHEDSDTGLEVVALVGLRTDVVFRIVVCAEVLPSEAKTLTVSTAPRPCWSTGVQLRNLMSTEIASRLTPSEISELICSQPTDWMIAVVDWTKRVQTFRLLEACYYNGLFTLPLSQSRSIVSLPNGLDRYVIDFERCASGCWMHHKKCKKLLQQQSTGQSSLRVVVNRDFGDTMRIAKKYHQERMETKHGDHECHTWISEDLIKAMELIVAAPRMRETVLLCAIELWEDKPEQTSSETETGGIPRVSSTLLAGCLGFAVGSVYHDFTMFTLRHDEHSYGSFLTKLIGAALQDCGYRMWYWGFRVEYMAEYEKRCGAVQMPRRTFYDLWMKHRDEIPVWNIATYLNGGRGLIPSTV